MTITTQSEIGIFPQDWTTCRVDSLFDIQQGKSVSKDHRIGDNQRPFLRTKNVFWGQIDLTELDRMHFTESEEAKLKLQTSDLLLCEGGDVGRTAIWNDQLQECFYQNHLHRLRAIADDIVPSFALYWFWYAFEVGNIYIGRSNVTTIPNLSQSKLSELRLPKPGIQEQNNIAKILTTVQVAIAQQTRLIALTRELKSALMHKLFTEGLRGEKQKETDIGLVPESWEIKRFDEFVTLQRGLDLPKYSFQKGTVPVIGATSVIGYHNKANVKGPGVTVVRSGSSVGKPLFIVDDFWAHNVVLYVKDFHENDIKFVYYKIQNLDLTQYKAGVAVPTLNRNTFKGIEVAIPPKNEQVEIASMLDATEKKAETALKKKNLLEELFRTLIHQLMTGQIRVNELDLPGLS